MGFTHAVRKQIKDCVMEARVKRLTRLETHALIQSRTGKDVSIPYIDYLIRTIKKHAPARLAELRETRHAFLDEAFKTIDEVERYMQEAWRLFHLSEQDRYLQLHCIRELHQLTITRSNIVDVIPHFSAMEVAKKPNETPIQSDLVSAQRGRSQAVF